MKKFLFDKVHEALTNPHAPLLLDQMSHRVITELFHELFYSPEYRGKILKIVYTTNSYPFELPLGRLSDPFRPEPEKKDADLRLSLISHRHPEMSYFVDGCLHLNSSVSGKEVSGRQTQRLATKSALSFLRSWASEEIWIELYHTGLTPVVVGTLIAIEELLYRVYLDGKTGFVVESRDKNFEAMEQSGRPAIDYKSNALITPYHQGSLPEDYMTLAVWY
jgi:hypothetical protein